MTNKASPVRPLLSHFAINADDVPATRLFYEQTFGWSFAPWGPPGFYRSDSGDVRGPGITAAIQQRRDLIPGHPVNGFECTISVADVRSTAAAALDNGGRVVFAPTTISGVGQLVWLADPNGNVVGAMAYDSSAE